MRAERKEYHTSNWEQHNDKKGKEEETIVDVAAAVAALLIKYILNILKCTCWKVTRVYLFTNNNNNIQPYTRAQRIKDQQSNVFKGKVLYLK